MFVRCFVDIFDKSKYVFAIYLKFFLKGFWKINLLLSVVFFVITNYFLNQKINCAHEMIFEYVVHECNTREEIFI